jgi:hypothetical protein
MFQFLKILAANFIFWGADMQQVHAECHKIFFNIKTRQWFLVFMPSKAHRARL